MGKESVKGKSRFEEDMWRYYTISPQTKICPLMVAKRYKGTCNYYCGKHEQIDKLTFCVWWTKYLKRAFFEDIEEPVEKMRKRCPFNYDEIQYAKMVEAYWAREHYHKGWKDEYEQKILEAEEIFRGQESNFSNYKKQNS